VATVTLTLLGPPSVQLTGGGRIVPQPGAKVLALLAFLTLEPGRHTREELAGLLWGESSEFEARASLRQALKQLRSLLGGSVCIDRSTVELIEPLQCDVQDFQQLVLQDPARALVTDIPRFLAGFSVRNAPRFDEWVADTRQQLLRQYHQALGTLARAAMGQWRWREAADLAERWLVGDPLSDEAVRLVVEARYLAGDRGGALARFTEYRAALKRETGCEPSRSLLGLVQRVEADATPVASRPVTDEWYARTPSFEASLIGREKEWGELVKAWHTVGRGTGQIVLIEGEAGVGKSRLAEEFLRWAVAEGGTVLRGHGYDGRAGVPFEPVVEMLRDSLGAPGLAGTAPEWLAEVARLVPELRQRFPAVTTTALAADAAEDWRLFEGVAQLILALAAERPVAILLDDLQWCDGDSCNLIRFLVRRSERAPVLWLGTVSLEELEHDAPSALLSRTLRAKPHAGVLRPAALSEEELWLMIRQMGHLSTPTGARRFAQRIFDVSGGNPFYVVELVKTMFAQGLLAVDAESGDWTAAPDALTEPRREVPISQTVHDVIAERVERLPEALRNLLVTVAVSGAPCRAEVLSHIHDISRVHVAALAEALAVRRFVAEESGAYRCAHPVVARVVRDRLSASRRREVHRSLALALETFASAEDTAGVAGEIARHGDQGGERALAYRFGLAAAGSALDRSAYGEALSWIELAGRNAREGAEGNEVKRVTALVLEAAGLSKAPPLAKLGGPITRGLEPGDFDLPLPQ
jgi:DNA-binding SARP family transcriptional activator